MIAALLIILMMATGCVHRTTSSQNFGLGGFKRQTSTRSILQQQTVRAFNVLADDPQVQTLQARLKVDPRDVAARLELAGVYENYRLYDEASDQYAESLRLSPSEQAVLGLGRCARVSGRAQQVIPQLEAFVKDSPTANTWNALGLLYDDSGDLAAGESALREAVSRDGESDRLHNDLGYNLVLQKKSGAAENEFRRALELNPKSATSRNNLGIVLTQRGDLKGALEQFQLAADAATAHNNLAVVLLEMGLFEQSREELVKALAIRHYFAPALANFKLVQERIRERAELLKAGRLPVNTPAKATTSKNPEDRR